MPAIGEPPSPTHRPAVLSRSALVWVAVGLMWLAGLVVGFVAILVIVARATCANGAAGLACGNLGTIIGVLLVAATVGVVGVSTVTVPEARSRPRMWLSRWGACLAVLVLLLVASRLMLATL